MGYFTNIISGVTYIIKNIHTVKYLKKFWHI